MHEFKAGDTVSLRFKGQECHGSVVEVGKRNATVFIDEIHEFKKLPIERLAYVPPVVLSAEQVKRLCRYEVKYSELIKGHPDYVSVLHEDTYFITFDDILTAIRNIKASGDDNDTIREEWFEAIWGQMYEYEEEQNAIFFEYTPDSIENLEWLPDRSQYIATIFSDMIERMLDEDQPFTESADKITEMLVAVMENERKPILERSYTDEEKESYIDHMCNDDRMKKASELELTVYRKFIDDLCAKDNKTALKCKGYGCYGGDPAYECDWNTSLECITKLYEMTGKPAYANTLGYIYYYGRCWDGQPKYDEAFKYFSVGAAGFYYESRYKLADMFVHGYAVPKNTKIAFSIVSELFDQNLKYMLKGKFDCKFADIALRLGSYMEKGYGGYVSEYGAYKLYLQAEFAIRQRLQYDHYGDLSVADSIRQRLNGILDSGKIAKPKRSARVDIGLLLENHLKKHRRLQLTIKPLKNGDLKLSMRVVPKKDEKYPRKLFITETTTGFCGMLEALNVRVKNGNIVESENINGIICFDDINSYFEPVSETTGVAFMLGDEIKADITGSFMFTSPAKASREKYRFASVYFTPGGSHYDYLLDIDGVEIGDTVIVMTDRGRTEVTVANIVEKSESELALPIGKYKKIIEKL